jgi:hypothetical protein
MCHALAKANAMVTLARDPRSLNRFPRGGMLEALASP